MRPAAHGHWGREYVYPHTLAVSAKCVQAAGTRTQRNPPGSAEFLCLICNCEHAARWFGEVSTCCTSALSRDSFVLARRRRARLLVEGLGVSGSGGHVGVTGSLVGASGELELVGGLQGNERGLGGTGSDNHKQQ